MIWTGIVHEINGDELTVELRADGHEDMFAEVSVSRWGLQKAEPGSILHLDTDAKIIRLLELGVWTRKELDKIKADAKARYERLMGLIE